MWWWGSKSTYFYTLWSLGRPTSALETCFCHEDVKQSLYLCNFIFQILDYLIQNKYQRSWAECNEFERHVKFIIANLNPFWIYDLLSVAQNFNWHLQLGFPANETFREKMRKLLVEFRKLFRKISHFFAKINETKTNKFLHYFFAKFSHYFFRETDWSEISRKNRKFSHFSWGNEMRKQSEMVAEKKMFAKNAKFSRNDFFFSLETLPTTD